MNGEARYTLTLESATGSRLRELPFIDAQLSQKINRPPSLRFTVAREDMLGVALEFPRRVRVKQNSTTLDICRIMRAQFQGDADGKDVISVEAEGLLGDLSRVDASTIDETKAADDIAADLIAAQTGTAYPQLTLGTVDFDDEISVQGGESDSALSLLNRMRDALGGQFWVSDTGALNWRVERYTFSGKRMRLKKNIAEFTASVDYRTIRTSVELEGANGITATATDESGYGPTIPYRQSYPNIGNVDTLQRVANQLLTLFKVPQNTIRVTAVDLATVNVNFAHEQIRLGERVRLYATNLTPDNGVVVRVTGVQRNLAEPISVRVDLDTDELHPRVEADLFDTLENIIRTTERDIELSNAAPPNVGSSSNAGTSGLAARGDHTHGPPTGGALTDWKDALGVGEVDLSDATPQKIVTPGNAAPGTSAEVARADHRHEWDIADFVTTADPNKAVTPGNQAAGTSIFVARSDHRHAWDITDFENVARIYFAANTSALSGTFRNGDAAYTTDDNQLWSRSDGVWEPVLRFEVST